jgi:hypothetical protein
MAIQLNPTEIQTLKAEAWASKRSMGIKISKALDTIAIKHGYPNWALLMKNFNRKSFNAKSSASEKTAQPAV